MAVWESKEARGNRLAYDHGVHFVFFFGFSMNLLAWLHHISRYGVHLLRSRFAK
jgi:hypothetical protein